VRANTVIRAENLGKKYLIRHQGQRERYTALRDVIAQRFSSAHRSALNLFKRAVSSRPAKEDFWALKDVNFEICQGEVVGIIGRNGAGKSTLLKILSRITEPSEGRVEIEGRVASLLEVGTGFHPELTGRENIYLNGTILGMTRAEIRRKFDEIVAFAEVEQFLDTPVKRYSSGMYVRLAFSVAAHMEPEILVVDEVLAVGDAEFQNRCIGKMKGVAQTGDRTILFVSHNMMATKQLCSRGMWFERGAIRYIGSVDEAVNAYLSNVRNSVASGGLTESVIEGDGQVKLLSYAVTNPDSSAHTAPVTGDDILIRVKLRAEDEIRRPACGISIYNQFGTLMTSINTVELGVSLPALPAGDGNVDVRIRNNVFLPGTYTACFWIMNPQGHIYAMTDNSIVFEIVQTPLYGTCEVNHEWGCVYSEVEFSSDAAEADLRVS
jgi:lipopolysaccharide transport system ATP-binding protein